MKNQALSTFHICAKRHATTGSPRVGMQSAVLFARSKNPQHLTVHLTQTLIAYEMNAYVTYITHTMTPASTQMNPWRRGVSVSSHHFRTSDTYNSIKGPLSAGGLSRHTLTLKHLRRLVDTTDPLIYPLFPIALIPLHLQHHPPRY